MAGSGLKRKGALDRVSDDFSEFSLSSPPTKIRRLDVELSPIPEIEEEMESVDAVNEERALVVFNPLPSPLSFTVHSNLLSPINNNWSKQNDSDCDRLIRSQEEEMKKQSLAIVPWVSSSYNSHVDDSVSNNTNTEEADEETIDMDMEIEEQDMDSIANMNSCPTSTSTIHPLTMHHGVSGIIPEGFHQWQQQQQQQQHCFLPQFPQNTSTPITWTR